MATSRIGEATIEDSRLVPPERDLTQMAGPEDAPRRPRVLVVSGYYDPFSSYQEVVIARALSTLADVRVVTGDRISPAFSDATLEALGLARRYPTAIASDGAVRIRRVPVLDLRSALLPWGLVRALKAEEPDVVLCLAVGQGFSLPAFWIPKSGIRVSIYGDNRAQWPDLGVLRSWLKFQLFRVTKGRAYRAAMARSQLVYALTPNTQTRLEMFARAPVALLPLAVDGDLFRPNEADRSEMRTTMGLDDVPVIGIVGKVSREKRLDLVLDALAIIGPTARWHLVLSGLGEDEYSASLRARIEGDSLLRERSTMLGFQSPSDLARLLRVADVCVWPRQPAITIQQAMVSGTRVVVPDNDLTGHLVSAGAQGRSFREGSVADLASALSRELHAPRTPLDRARRRELARNYTAGAVAAKIMRDADVPLST